MTKDKINRSQGAKSARKRNADAALLDDSTPSKDHNDVSDQGDSDGTGRNGDYNAKTNETESSTENNCKNNDEVRNGKSKTLSGTQGIELSGNSSDGGGNAKLAADSNKNKEQWESNGEEEKPAPSFLDPMSPLPQKRRKKPSQKLRMQQEVEEELEEMESRDFRTSKQSHRRHPKRKANADYRGIRYNRNRLSKLDPVVEKVVLDRALQKGLPRGWKVAFHKDWNRKVWISPDETRICDTVPRAIMISRKKALEAEVEDAEMEVIDSDGKSAGGVGVHDDTNDDDEVEDGTRVAGSFVKLKKGPSTLGNDPASILITTSEELHELSVDQERAALKKGRDKGLKRDGWRCVWNSRFRRKNWVSPQGKLFGNLSRAVEKQDDWIIKEEKRRMKENRKMQEMEEEWQKQFKRLKKYKRKHGDTLVPDNYERSVDLRLWVRKQRREYLRAQKGEKSSITTEQIEALNQLGFQWEIVKASKQVGKSKHAIKDAVTGVSKAPPPPAPPNGSIFDNAPEEMFTRRHVLFSDMQPPLVSPPRIPIKFVNPVKKLPNGSLGTESYCREVEQYLKTWYGV
mmetsp:Transcript_8745/g.20934  ORF Transcript_8745/g.20934 Transcript_8745/m.20934 type:complete len:571 (+) Transcript_8745:70-1782(+)